MEPVSKTRAWIEAVRVRTLPVSIAGVICGIGYAALEDESMDWGVAVVCLVFALLCQTASNFANEYFDYRAGRDKAGRVGPRRGVTEGDISPQSMLKATIVLLTIACGLGLSLALRGGWWLVGVGAAVVAGVFAYSAGPWPLSTHGLGEVAVIIFFGLVPVGFTYYLITLQWSWLVAVAGIGIGCLGANVLIVNNYRDVEDDIAAGKRTLAVVLGRQAMPSLYLANAIAAVVFMQPGWRVSLPGIWGILPQVLVIGLTAWAGVRISRKSGPALNAELGRTAMLLVAYALAFAVCALW